MSIVLGPILQFRGFLRNTCEVSALVVTDLGDPAPPAQIDQPQALVAAPRKLADLPFENPTKTAWRYDMVLPLSSGRSTFELETSLLRMALMRAVASLV